MCNQSVEIVHRGICHLGEGPIWNARLQKLFWTDIYNRKIWAYDPEKSESTVFCLYPDGQYGPVYRQGSIPLEFEPGRDSGAGA
nr:SMP-30/gluconolactonase/LRE family protein [Ruminiclostridium cellobioparum]